MFTKNQINVWMELGTIGQNARSEKDYKYLSDLKLVPRLLESKVMTDRWGNVATAIVIHSSKKELVREQLGNNSAFHKEGSDFSHIPMSGLIRDLIKFAQNFSDAELKNNKNLLDDELDNNKNVSQYTCDMIWGAKIYYSDLMPDDQGMMLSLSNDELSDEEFPSRSVAIFPI